MPAARVAPCLEILDGRVVKRDALTGVGDPVEMASRYYREGADELYVMDVSGTDEGVKAALGVIRRVSRRVFIPLTFGGVRSVEDAKNALLAGADRISMATAPLGRPGIVEECADAFGSERVALAIYARRVGGAWHAFVSGGRTDSGRNVVEWAREGAVSGAGEILVRSLDADGRMQGYDIDLIRAVSGTVSVPVMAFGGAGSPEHVYQVIRESGADGAVLASALHSRLCTIPQIKGYLASRGIAVRA